MDFGSNPFVMDFGSNYQIFDFSSKSRFLDFCSNTKDDFFLHASCAFSRVPMWNLFSVLVVFPPPFNY
jgi:hypothetical protein